MTSVVYLVRITDWKNAARALTGLTALMRKTPTLDAIAGGNLTAIKLTFGEDGNHGHAPASLVRALVDEVRSRGGRPFLTETNTLYNGRRRNTIDHLELAREHGFTQETIGAPIIISDGLRGREGFELELPGPLIRSAHLAPVLRDTDCLIGVAHLTGHLLTGMGGAIKNLGMGLANRAGKLAMHGGVSPAVRAESCTLCLRCQEACAAGAISTGPISRSEAPPGGTMPDSKVVIVDRSRCTGCAECLAVCPSGAIKIDWSNDARMVQQKMAEYATGAVRAVGGRVACINLLNRISRHCDCLSDSELIAPDVGIVASTDPVALDQASLDLVRAAVGADPFRLAWPESDPEDQIRHAQAAGLGTRSYEIEVIHP